MLFPRPDHPTSPPRQISYHQKNRQCGKLLERWNATYNWLECGHPALVTGLVLEKYPAKSKGWLLAQWVVGLEFEVNLWRTRLTEMS